MSTAATKRPSKPRPAAVDAAYLDLVRQFPLRAIRSKADSNAAAAMLDGRVLRDLGRGEQDYLQVLTGLVEAYDTEHDRLGE